MTHEAVVVIFIATALSCHSAARKQDGKAPTPKNHSTQGEPDRASHGWSQLTEIDAPAPRYRAVVLQSDAKVVIFGGYDGDNVELDDGGSYDLKSVSWTKIPSHGQNRLMNSVGLAGDYLVTWGSDSRENWRSVSGMKHKLGSNQWEPITSQNAPSARYLTPAFSLGDRLLIWGGHPNCDLVDGKIYDPAVDVWQSVAAVPKGVTAGCDNIFFTGSKLIVWGNYPETPGSVFSNGAIYNPTTNSWDSMAAEGQPYERQFSLLLANDDYVVVWGGRTRYQHEVDQKDLHDGGIYEIASKSWRKISNANHDVPGGAQPTGAIVGSNHIFVWGGGSIGGSPTNLGGVLDLTGGTWSAVTLDNAPRPRVNHLISTLDARRVLIFGGNDGANSLFDGSIYDFEVNSWSPVGENPDLPARRLAAMLWMSDPEQAFFVWGGSTIEQNKLVLVPGGGLWRPHQ